MKNKSIKLSLMIPYLSVILLATACKKDDLSAENNTVATASTSSETLALDAPTATTTTTSTTSTTTRIEAENYASMSGVIKETCSEGGQNVGAIQAGDWMKYTVTTPAAGAYKLNFRVGSYAGGGQFQVKNAAGTVLATVTAPKTGSYQTYTTVSVNANLAAGSQTIQLYAVSAGYNINWFEVVGGTTSSGTSDSSTSGSTSGTTTPTTSTGALGSATIGSNTMFRETFEGTSPWSGFGQEWYTSYAFTTATTPALQGSKVGRFELRDTDPNYRSEVRFPSSYNGKDRWVSFSVYWPSSGMKDDSKPELFHQAHQTSQTSPPVSLIVKNGHIWAEVNGQVFSGSLGSGTSKTMDIGAVPKDQWVRFVIHYKFSYNTDGAWQIWKNGSQVLNYAGKTIYPPAITSNLPTFKLGIYKWVWSGTATSDATLRVMYVDDVRVGNETSSLSTM